LKHLRTLAFAVGGLISLSGLAEAHFTLKAPTSWTDEAQGKGGFPCGSTGPTGNPASKLTNIVTPATGGHTLKISIHEGTFHPGHYRVALSILSRSELPKDPIVYSDVKKTKPTTTAFSAAAEVQTPPIFPVIADNMLDHTAPFPTDPDFEVTLPNITCAKCTLQIIEFMGEHPPDYFYRHCADLSITADPSLPPMAGADGGAADAGTDAKADAGGNAGASGSAGANGAAGMSGAGGSTSGAAGAAGGTSGSAGGTGSAGASGGSAGASGGSAGASGGTAGSRGGGGSSGGCAIAGTRLGGGAGASTMMLLGLALFARRRRR
jgi:hypothetical protein